jgi:hypothetical protein
VKREAEGNWSGREAGSFEIPELSDRKPVGLCGYRSDLVAFPYRPDRQCADYCRDARWRSFGRSRLIFWGANK